MPGEEEFSSRRSRIDIVRADDSPLQSGRSSWFALFVALSSSVGCGTESDTGECSGVSLRGDVGAASVSANASRGHGSGVFGGSDWRVHASFPGALFWGEGTVPSPPSTAWEGTGYVLGFSPPTGQMITGTLTMSGEPGGLPDLSQPAVLTDLFLLGACGGTSVEGSLELCRTANIVTNPDQCSGTTASLTGTLGGQEIALSSSSLQGSGLGSPQNGTLTKLSDSGLRAHLTSSTGILIMPPTGPRANEVLCASAQYTEDATRETWTLTDITVAGALPGTSVSGRLELLECSR